MGRRALDARRRERLGQRERRLARSARSTRSAAEVTAVALEFGTVDTISVLQALRADAVLHASGDPLCPMSDAVRAQVRAAFADDDPAWFDAVAARFDEVIARSVDQPLVALTGSLGRTYPLGC